MGCELREGMEHKLDKGQEPALEVPASATGWTEGEGGRPMVAEAEGMLGADRDP